MPGFYHQPFDLYLDDIVFWLQKAGGISTYWLELIRYCEGRGLTPRHTVQGLPSTSLYASAVNQLHADCTESARVKWNRYRAARVAAPAGARGVFHSSYYRRCARPELAQVVTVYDFTYEYFRSGLARAVHSWQKFSAIRHADAVICISENTRADLLRFLPEVDPARVHAIHLGGGEMFAPFGADAVAPAGPPYVMFVGARSGYKRFELAVEAVAGNAALTLKIVGPALMPAEVALLEARLKGRWHHAGQVSSVELNRLYNHAFALVYPSDYEGFGIPLLEAMRAGCPVVCSSLSSLPEVAGEAALMASEQSGEDYAHQLSRLADESLRRALIAQGYDRAMAFTWETCFDKTLDIYRRVLAEKYGAQGASI